MTIIANIPIIAKKQIAAGIIIKRRQKLKKTNGITKLSIMPPSYLYFSLGQNHSSIQSLRPRYPYPQ